MFDLYVLLSNLGRSIHYYFVSMFQVLNELSSYNRDDIFVTNIVIRSIASRLGLVRMHVYGVALMMDLEERGRSGLLS
jgi:NADH:ubiquinone oxidoreductase subunit E